MWIIATLATSQNWPKTNDQINKQTSQLTFSGFLFFFGWGQGQFCDAAKVVMIHLKI